MTQPNQPTGPILPDEFKARVRDNIKGNVNTKTHGPTQLRRVDLVKEFGQSPEDLEDRALEQVWVGMNEVFERTDAGLTHDEKREEREAVANFYLLMEQVEKNLPLDLQELYANDFLSTAEAQALKSAQDRRTITLQQRDDLTETKDSLTARNSDNQSEIARRNNLSPLQVAGEVVGSIVDELHIEVQNFPNHLRGFSVGPRSESEQEQIKNFVEAHNKILELVELQTKLRHGRQGAELGAYINTSPYVAEIIAGIQEFDNETQELAEEIDANNSELITIRSSLSEANAKLIAQEGQINSYEGLAEPQRQRYMETLISAFLTHISQDPTATAIVEAYMDAQNEFYTAAQENVANVGGLKSLIRRIDAVTHEKNGDILQKWLSVLASGGVAARGGFQTFRGLMNLLPRHVHALPEGVQDMLLHADGSTNQQGVIVGSAVVGLIVGYIAKKWMKDVNTNMNEYKRNTFTKMPTKKDIFWTRLSWGKRSAMAVVFLMIMMDITGHMATFMGTDKKKLEGKKIEAAKDELVAAMEETTTYMRTVPDESISATNELLDNEAAQGGAGQLYAAKKRITVGGTDGTNTGQFPGAITKSEEIVKNAGGHDGMLVEAQSSLDADLKHLQGMKNISYKGRNVSWIQIPSTVLSLGSGIFDLETNMEIQDIVTSFTESVHAYSEALKKTAEQYNLSLQELEKILSKMEGATYSDRTPLEFKAIDEEKMTEQITKLEAAASRFSEELKKVDPNFDMFDIPATLRFFKEADFGMLGLAEKLLLILGLSFLSVWYMLNQYRLLRKEMKNRNTRLGTLNPEFMEVRKQFAGVVQSIAPYLTHLDLQAHFRELFTQMGGQFDTNEPMQNQLLSFMDSRLDDSTQAILKDIFGITVVREPWFSELPTDERNAFPRRQKKRMKNEEKLARAYQDGRVNKVCDELKAIITAHKTQIDIELDSFISMKSLEEEKRELRTDWFLRHEGHDEHTLISTTAELIKESPTFAHLFFDRYNTKTHDDIAPGVQNNTPVANPTSNFSGSAPVVPSSPPIPPRSWSNGFGLRRRGNA